MAIIDKLLEASKNALVKGDGSRPLLQMLIADIQGAAKRELVEVTDIHCVTVLKKTLKKLVESQALAPLTQLDEEFKWLCEYLLPKEVSDEILQDLITELMPQNGPLTLNTIMTELTRRGEGTDFLVNKKRLVTMVKESNNDKWGHQ